MCGTNRLYRWLKRVFAGCVALAFFWILAAGGYMLAACLLYMGALAAILPRIRDGAFPAWLCLITLCVRLLLIVCVKTEPSSDFALQYRAAQQFAAGDFSYLTSAYFQKWGYQVGLVIYEGFLWKLWGSIYILKISNALFTTATVWLVYILARELTGERAARMASGLYAAMLFPMLYVTALNNSIPSAFFLLLAFHLLLSEPPDGRFSFRRYGCVGLCCAAAQFFRPDMPLFLAALLAASLFAWLRERSRRQAWFQLRRFAVVAVVFLAVFSWLSWGTKALGWTVNGLKNEEPLWNLVVGTNLESGGTWTPEIEGKITTLQKSEEIGRTDAERRIVRENLSASKGALLRLLSRKLAAFWLNPTLSWSLPPSELANGLTEFAGAQQLLLVLWACAGCAAFFVRSQTPDRYLLPFFVMATFFAYLLLEVQPRYSYLVQAVLAVLSAFAFERAGPAVRGWTIDRGGVKKCCL